MSTDPLRGPHVGIPSTDTRHDGTDTGGLGPATGGAWSEVATELTELGVVRPAVHANEDTITRALRRLIDHRRDPELAAATVTALLSGVTADWAGRLRAQVEATHLWGVTGHGVSQPDLVLVDQHAVVRVVIEAKALHQSGAAGSGHFSHISTYLPPERLPGHLWVEALELAEAGGTDRFTDWSPPDQLCTDVRAAVAKHNRRPAQLQPHAVGDCQSGWCRHGQSAVRDGGHVAGLAQIDAYYAYPAWCHVMGNADWQAKVPNTPAEILWIVLNPTDQDESGYPSIGQIWNPQAMTATRWHLTTHAMCATQLMPMLRPSLVAAAKDPSMARRYNLLIQVLSATFQHAGLA